METTQDFYNLVVNKHMNISASVASASGMQTGDAVGILVQRKAMDIQEAQAVQLINSVAQSVPRPQGNLGQNINVRA
ncbi:MAG: YjfB family protein [Gammaproteobacteria bacterium]|nr:YjfB family protein [Gammaproteobacteria bacterium]NNJ92229.1 YjfB family protein [Gammaproteobacteria bacterium]